MLYKNRTHEGSSLMWMNGLQTGFSVRGLRSCVKNEIKLDFQFSFAGLWQKLYIGRSYVWSYG